MQPLTLMPEFDIIQSKWIMDSLRCLLSQWIQSSLSQRWFLLPFRKTQTTNQVKWSSTKTQCTSYSQYQNHRHYHVLCSIIWNRLRFHQRKICCAPSQFPTWNGPHLRYNTISISQHFLQHNHHWHSCTLHIQSYRHALLLASWLISPKTIHVHWKQVK